MIDFIVIECIAIYIGISTIINPLTTSLYVTKIGNSMGLELLDEIGNIRNKKTQKILNHNAKNIKFIQNLSNAGSFPWFCFHPLSMPYSFCYATTSTFNGINYLLYNKTIVENGEFDE